MLGGIYGFEVPCGNCTVSVDHPAAACNAGFDFYVDGDNQETSSIDIVVGDLNQMINQNLNIVANFVHTDMNGDGFLAVNG